MNWSGFFALTDLTNSGHMISPRYKAPRAADRSAALGLLWFSNDCFYCFFAGKVLPML